MSIKTPLEVALNRLPSGLRRLLKPTPVVFKHYVPEDAAKQQMRRLSDAQRETFLDKEQLYGDISEDFFFRQYELPDGRRATLVLQGGVERWYIEPIEEIQIQIQQFLAAYLVMEHGWITKGFIATPGLQDYDIHLSELLVDYYAGQGDPVCPQGYDHFYGVSTEAEACDFGMGYIWNDALPADQDPSVVENLDEAGVNALNKFYEDPLRDAARYSGLARLAAQAMGAFRPITKELFSSSLGVLHPLYFGIVRNYDGTRLDYWLVKVVSGGVGMLKLGWPVSMASIAAAVLTGEVNGEILTPEQRTRYETLLLSRLTTQASIEGGELDPIVVVTKSQHEALIGGQGFAFLDGQPFFSPQPWGTDKERSARCILTDIRQRFDLGANNNDPWEMAITLEYTFMFDSEGNPSCHVQKLHEDKWWPRAIYVYMGEKGQICRKFPFSISADSPSHTDAVVAAWYDANGNRCKLRSLKRQVDEGALSTSHPGEPSIPILGIPPDSGCFDYGQLGCEDKGHRYTDYKRVESSWELVTEGGQPQFFEIEQLEFSELLERSISLSYSEYVWTHSDQQARENLGGEQTNNEDRCSYLADAPQIDECDAPLWAQCLTNSEIIQSGPNAGQTAYNASFFKHELVSYSLEGSEERYTNLNNGFKTTKGFILRMGPSRDIFAFASRKTVYAGTGVDETYVPWSEDGMNKGYGGTKSTYNIYNSNQGEWVGSVTRYPQYVYVLPHSSPCSSLSMRSARLYSGSYPDNTSGVAGRSTTSELKTSTTYNDSSITTNDCVVYAPGYNLSKITINESDAEALLDSLVLQTREYPCFRVVDQGFVASAGGKDVIVRPLSEKAYASGGYVDSNGKLLPGRFIGSA